MQFTCTMGPVFRIKVIKNSPWWKISKNPAMNQDQAKQTHKKRNKVKTTDRVERQRQEELANRFTDRWTDNKQTVRYTVNKQVQFSPPQPGGGRSVRSQTQPIPFLRAKASVTMWSISIPEDSSVREAKQAVASISHDHVHISELT